MGLGVRAILKQSIVSLLIWSLLAPAGLPAHSEDVVPAQPTAQDDIPPKTISPAPVGTQSLNGQPTVAIEPATPPTTDPSVEPGTQQSAQAAQQAKPNSGSQSDRNKKLLIAGGVMAAVVVALLLFANKGGGGG